MSKSRLARRLGLLLSVFSVAVLLSACGNEVTVSGNPSPATTSTATTSAPTTTTAATSTQAVTTPPATTVPATTIAPIVVTTVAKTKPPTPSLPPPSSLATAPTYSAIANTTKLGGLGKLVYSVGGETYLINPDGTSKTRLNGVGKSPVFSPDGQRIASIVDDYTLISTKLDGSDKKTHCNLTGGNFPYLERWSPNGRFVASAGVVLFADFFSCDMQAKAGTQSQPILRTYPGNKSAPAPPANVYDWSPDNEYTIWQSTDENYVGTIYYGSATKGGADAVAVVKGTANNSEQNVFFQAKIAPGGKTIAVLGKRIFFASVPGQKSNLEGITLETFDKPVAMAFAPNGQYLAVINNGATKKGLFIYNFDAAQVTQLTNDENITRLDWSLR